MKLTGTVISSEDVSSGPDDPDSGKVVGFVVNGSDSADKVLWLSAMISFSGLEATTERANVNKRTVTVTASLAIVEIMQKSIMVIISFINCVWR